MALYFEGYLILNVLLALVITLLFAWLGSTFVRAIVTCNKEAPIATVRILSLVYGSLALGRVFLENKAFRSGLSEDQMLLNLSNATGGNLMFFAITAGIGIAVLIGLIKPVVTIFNELAQESQ